MLFRSENEIKRLALLAGDRRVIGPDIVSGKLRAVAEQVESALPALQAGADVEFTETYSLYDYLAEHEKQFIIRALKEKGGIEKHAAAILNIPESTLRLKIKQYNIDPKHLDAVN